MSEINTWINGLKDFQTRSQARKNLIEAGPASAGEQLIDFAKNSQNKDNAVWAAIAVFKEWKWTSAVNLLINLLEERPNLQNDILAALNNISGVNFGDDAAVWREAMNSPGVFMHLRAEFIEDELISFAVIDGYSKIVLPAPGARKQEVLVYENEAALTVYTECGNITEGQVAAVNALNETTEFAELSCIDDGTGLKVTLTSEWHGEVDYGALKDQVVKLAHYADDIERQLTGEDNI